MKKVLALVLVLLMAFAVVGCTKPEPAPSNTPAENTDPTPAPAQPVYWSLAGGPSGGAYYAIHGGISDLLNKYSDGHFNTKVELTAGSQENVRLVGAGECEIGLCNANHGYFGVNGTNMYSEPQNIKSICALHYSVYSVVVREESSYQTLKDLKGKKVYLGTAGSGGVSVMEAWLSLYGMTLDDIVPVYMEFEQGVEQFKNKQVEAFCAMGGYPYAALTELSTTEDIRHIQFDKNELDALKVNYPYFSTTVIPAGTYKTETNDVQVIGIANDLLINADVSEDDAYLATKILYEHLTELGDYHASAKKVTREGLINNTVELHPGAAKFYKEVGLLK